MADQKMRRSLSKALSGRMSILSVQNPLDASSELSEIRFSDKEWQPRVRDLIRAASLIFVYLGDPSRGTRIEVEMIRKEGRAGQTAVIIGSGKGDPALNSIVSSFTQGTGGGVVGVRPVKAEKAASLEDFAVVVAGNSLSPRRLLSRLETKCADGQAELLFCSTPPLPSGRVVDSKIAKELVKIGRSEYVKGEAHQERRESYLAESAFHSAVSAFWAADDSRRLAAALLELGRTLLLQLQEASRAADVLEWALEIYVELEVTEMISSASQEYAIACVHADPPRLDQARAAIERALALRSNDSDWGRFATYATIEEIEKKAGRDEAARAAFDSAFEAYRAYRRNGGEPQSRARLWTAMYIDFRDQGRGDFGKFVTETKWLDQLPELRANLLELCKGGLKVGDLMAGTQSLDERFELAALLTYVGLAK